MRAQLEQLNIVVRELEANPSVVAAEPELEQGKDEMGRRTFGAWLGAALGMTLVAPKEGAAEIKQVAFMLQQGGAAANSIEKYLVTVREEVVSTPALQEALNQLATIAVKENQRRPVTFDRLIELFRTEPIFVRERVLAIFKSYLPKNDQSIRNLLAALIDSGLRVTEAGGPDLGEYFQGRKFQALMPRAIYQVAVVVGIDKVRGMVEDLAKENPARIISVMRILMNLDWRWALKYLQQDTLHPDVAQFITQVITFIYSGTKTPSILGRPTVLLFTSKEFQQLIPQARTFVLSRLTRTGEPSIPNELRFNSPVQRINLIAHLLALAVILRQPSMIHMPGEDNVPNIDSIAYIDMALQTILYSEGNRMRHTDGTFTFDETLLTNDARRIFVLGHSLSHWPYSDNPSGLVQQEHLNAAAEVVSHVGALALLQELGLLVDFNRDRARFFGAINQYEQNVAHIRFAEDFLGRLMDAAQAASTTVDWIRMHRILRSRTQPDFDTIALQNGVIDYQRELLRMYFGRDPINLTPSTPQDPALLVLPADDFKGFNSRG